MYTIHKDVLDISNQIVESLLYAHLGRVPKYVEYFQETSKVDCTSILPKKLAQLTISEAGHLTYLISPLRPAQRERAMFIAATEIFKGYKANSLIHYMTFKNLLINGRLESFHTIFILDSIVVDPIRRIYTQDIRSYIKELLTTNSIVCVSKNYSSYIPSDLFSNHLTAMEWTLITKRRGVTCQMIS